MQQAVLKTHSINVRTNKSAPPLLESGRCVLMSSLILVSMNLVEHYLFGKSDVSQDTGLDVSKHGQWGLDSFKSNSRLSLPTESKSRLSLLKQSIVACTCSVLSDQA